MTIKSQSDYRCSKCNQAWLPFEPGLMCPSCAHPASDNEVAGIFIEALESAKFNKRLYGHIELEFWIVHSLGDRYLEWGFKALQLAESQPNMRSEQVALGALMDLDLEELTPLRAHVMAFLKRLVERYREAVTNNPQDWQKMPEPEKPFFGRKIIED
jgi:hypothetical protein